MAAKEAVKQLLSDYDEQFSLRRDVDVRSRVQLLARYEELLGAQQVESEATDLQGFLSGFREAFLNELLLLPAAAEECLMTVILYLHCEQAALKCIEHFMKTEVKAATESLVALQQRVLALAEELAEIRWWPEAGWPQGMANWARMAVSDGRQEAGGLVLNLASLRFSGQEPRLLQHLEHLKADGVDRRVERALGVAPSDLDTSRWAQWGNVGLMARKQAFGPGARLVATWRRPWESGDEPWPLVLRDFPVGLHVLTARQSTGWRLPGGDSDMSVAEPLKGKARR